MPRTERGVTRMRKIFQFRFRNFVLRVTHRMWNKRISAILCRAYSSRVINSQQLHELTAKFDPTQSDSKEVYMR